MPWIDEEEENTWGSEAEALQKAAERNKQAIEQYKQVIVGTYKPAAQKEVIVTDPNTGGKKGQKLQRFSLIPRDFLWALASHYGVGAKKYEDRNWERGYKWSLSQDAFERHFTQWQMAAANSDHKAKYDEETGTHHLIAAIWHLIALYVFDTRDLGSNDIGG